MGTAASYPVAEWGVVMVRRHQPGAGDTVLSDAAREAAAPVAAARARADVIRRTIQDLSVAGARLCVTLADAHDARDWVHLGYRSYGGYLAGEYGISRGHGYRLVEHARVIRTLAEAAELGPEQIGLPERASRRIATRLAEIAAEVRDRTQGMPPSERPAIVAEVVSETSLSPAGDTPVDRQDAERAARAVMRMVAGDDNAVPERLASAIAEILGADPDALERWADYLADASALLRRRGGRGLEVGGRRHRALPRKRAGGAAGYDQMELWPAELLSAEEGR